MKKKSVPREYLLVIASHDVKDTSIYAYDMIESLKSFTREYLGGVMELEVSGYSLGFVRLKVPVFSYFIRLICEPAEETPAKMSVTISDQLTMRVEYPAIRDNEMTAYLISVAKLTGFKVRREGDVLIFTADTHISPIMKLYASSYDEVMYWLVTTYNV